MRWVGLAPVLFGMSQVGHGLIFPRIAGDKYSPGFLVSIWLKAVAFQAAFSPIGVAGPNLVGHNKNSPHAFTKEQMGRYEVESTPS